MDILTVTLNPSLDRTLVTRYAALGYHNLTTDLSRVYPAGHGVNLTRALLKMKVASHALVLLGDDAIGKAYAALMADEQIPHTFVHHPGTTRNNIIVYDTGHGNETVYVENASEAPQSAIGELSLKIEALAGPGSVVVFSGSLPDGLTSDLYRELILAAHNAGAATILDVDRGCESTVLDAPLTWVSLTQNQAEAFFRVAIRDNSDFVYYGRKIIEQGAQQVLFSLADTRGAMLITKDKALLIDLSDSEFEGTHTGFDDALLAGVLAGQLNKLDPEETLELGVAAALYAHNQVGNEFGALREVRLAARRIEVEQAG